MSNFTVTEKDTKQAEQIRRQYLDRQENKMEQLRALDSKVKKPGTILSYIVGSIGALVMGGGMSLVMVNGNMTTGIVLGLVGMAVAAVAYPIYKAITGNRKKKFASEIMQLSSEIVGSQA